MNNQHTEQIRQILDKIDKDSLLNENSPTAIKDMFELPSIISSVVDYLQPLLVPYEIAIYWYMFRHSVIDLEKQYIRVSVRRLMKGVVLSNSGQSDSLSYGTVQKVMLGLESKKVIAKSGDTNRDGTLYKVCLPEEIDICREYKMNIEQRQELKAVREAKDLDYYNIQDNREKVFERDNYLCHYCGKQLTRFSATLDHIQPVSQGGTNEIDNLVTACLHCNSQRGCRPVQDYISNKGHSQDFDV